MRQSVRAVVINGDKMLVMHRNKFGKEYYTLIGGGVKFGEAREQAMLRELAEETGIQVANPRLVIVENDDKFYGPQFVFLCDYVSGEPQLSPDSDEAKITELGKNIYTPMWLPIAQLNESPFVAEKLKTVLADYIQNGFPEQPVTL